MFQWLFARRQSHGGVAILQENFSLMMTDAYREMELGCSAFLRTKEASDIKEDLFILDKKINKMERLIRRELFTNAVVSTSNLIPCFIFMSVVKDAERLGDIAKNFYDLAIQGGEPTGGMRDQMEALTNELLDMTQKCREIFEKGLEKEAKELIFRASEVEDDCDEKINWYLKDRPNTSSMDVVYVLALRYFKRYASHLRNITSSVVRPLHKIDFTGKIVRKFREENAE